MQPILEPMGHANLVCDARCGRTVHAISAPSQTAGKKSLHTGNLPLPPEPARRSAVNRVDTNAALSAAQRHGPAPIIGARHPSRQALLHLLQLDHTLGRQVGEALAHQRHLVMGLVVDVQRLEGLRQLLRGLGPLALLERFADGIVGNARRTDAKPGF